MPKPPCSLAQPLQLRGVEVWLLLSSLLRKHTAPEHMLWYGDLP
jgi:hypothetical protein